jgi:uncharacterized protein YqjF (DUF2071 family)
MRSGRDSLRQSTRAGEFRLRVFAAGYHPIGDVYAPQRGSLDHFLTERYCLYTMDPSGYRQRVDIIIHRGRSRRRQ